LLNHGKRNRYISTIPFFSIFWRITIATFPWIPRKTEADTMGETDFEDYAAELATRNAWALEAEVPKQRQRTFGKENGGCYGNIISG
jgi:hypothetical protein